MSDESTGESQPADDLRSVLAAAAEASEKPAVEVAAAKSEPKAETATESEVTDAEVDAQLAADADAERAPQRGADGKFVKKDGDKAEAAAESDKDDVKADSGTQAAGIEPPVNWKAEDKEAFKKLPADAQKLVSEMVKRQDADYTRKTQAIAALKNEYEPVDKMFEPYRARMKELNFTPRTIIEAWANVEKRLTENPLPVLVDLARGYKVDVAKLVSALGFKAGEASPAAEGEQPQHIQLPPDVQARLDKLDNLERTVSGLTQAQRDQQTAVRQAGEARVQNEIDQFKGAKDDKGNLLHPHFEDVEQQMALLAQTRIAAGQPVPGLKQLYEDAVWANPSTRESLLTARQQQEETKRKDEARAKAAAAKRAASSVTGAPSPGQAPNTQRRSDRSIREELDDAYDDANAAA